MRKTTIAEVKIIWRNQVVEETILLEERQRNSIKKQEGLKELEKDDGIVYVEERIYISSN